MNKTLAKAEKAVPAKLMLLLDRYAGNSLALPAHTGVDDTVYGSLAMYQQEIIDELSVWVSNHSLAELNEIITSMNDPKYTEIWDNIKKKLI